MDINLIIQLINGVGFPIFGCIALGMFIVWDKKTRRNEAKSAMLEQTKLILTLQSTVEANTEAVNALVTAMAKEGFINGRK